MAKADQKGKVPPPPSAPLSTQVKVILISALVIGGVGFAFGAVSLGMFLGTQPMNNYNDNSQYYTYNNYTTYNTNYNTTYIYNNATRQRSIYNCCLFQVDALPGEQNVNFIGDHENESYYFNLSLQQRTIIEFFQLRSLAPLEMDDVRMGYNISINGDSASHSSYPIAQNINPNRWYGFSGISTLPNGTGYICQFRIHHGDIDELGYFQIIIGYTIYL